MSKILDNTFFEKVVIRLLFKKQTRECILPFLNINCFDNFSTKEIVKAIFSFDNIHENFPKAKDLTFKLTDKKIHDDFIDILKMDLNEYTEDILLQEVEKFIRKKLIFSKIVNYNELNESGKFDEINPEELYDIKGFSFKTNIGLDIFQDDGQLIYDIINHTDEFIPTSLKKLNVFLGGGFAKKAMTIFVGGTNVGKTLIKCSLAADCLMQNKKVLYITLEMPAKRIGLRIVQNILDTDYKTLKTLSLETIKEKVNIIKRKLEGRLLISDFPASTFTPSHLKRLLKEYKEKNKFEPDAIFIDYLGLMVPSTKSKGSNTNDDLKKVAEEIHGIAKSYDVAMCTSMQFNRAGLKSNSPDLTDVADSIGSMFTADDVILITQPEELLEEQKYELIKAKSRFTARYIKTFLNIDYNKMKVFEDDGELEFKKNNDTMDKAIEMTSKFKKDETPNEWFE